MKKRFEVVVYELTMLDDDFLNSRMIRDLIEFERMSSMIVVNPMNDDIKDVEDKIYIRDLFSRDYLFALMYDTVGSKYDYHKVSNVPNILSGSNIFQS